MDSARIFIALPSGTAAVPPLIESCVRRSILVARPGFLGSQVPAWICPPAAERSPAVASAADVSRDQQRSKTKNSSDDGGRRPHRQPQPTNAATCMEGRSHQATQDSPKLKKNKNSFASTGHLANNSAPRLSSPLSSRDPSPPQNFITSKNKPDVYDCKLKTNISKSPRTGKHQHQGFVSLTKHPARGRSNIATAEKASDVTARIRRSDYQIESLSRIFTRPPAHVSDPYQTLNLYIYK